MSDQHLDLDALADALAGEPPTHLEDCGSCAAALRDLAAAMGSVQTALAGLPEPELPDEVAARLDAALARASTAGPDTGTPDAVPAPAAASAATITPLDARRRVRWLPAASGVAAAAALVVGAVIIWPGGTGGSNSGARDSSLASRRNDGIPTSSSGTDYGRDGVLLKQALPGLLTGSAAPAKAGGQAPVVGSGTTGGSTGSGAEASPDSGAPTAVDPLGPLRTTQRLASCLAALTDPADKSLPLALDYASFEGKPALVVVLPSASAGKVDVFVVAAGCSQADAQLLLFSRLSRS